MAEKKSRWLDAVLRFERAMGTQVESVLRSDAYFDWVTQANRARARTTELIQSVSEEWLRLFNLPAGSDIRKLREQLSRMERQLDKLSKRIADAEADDGKPRPKRTT